MSAFIEEHRTSFRVEPICAVLPITLSTYYLARPARCGGGCAARAFPWPAARSSA